MINKISDNEGTALLMTLLMLTGMLTIALGMGNIVMSGLSMSRNQVNSTQAFFAAEAGAERSLWEVRKNNFDNHATPDMDTQDLFISTLVNGSRYDVDYASSSPNLIYTSQGSYLGTRRTVNISF